MNDLAHLDLIRVHHVELRQEVEHQRLVTATRLAARQRRLGRQNLLHRLIRRMPWPARGVAEAEPCPP